MISSATTTIRRILHHFFYSFVASLFSFFRLLHTGWLLNFIKSTSAIAPRQGQGPPLVCTICTPYVCMSLGTVLVLPSCCLRSTILWSMQASIPSRRQTAVKIVRDFTAPQTAVRRLSSTYLAAEYFLPQTPSTIITTLNHLAYSQ